MDLLGGIGQDTRDQAATCDEDGRGPQERQTPPLLLDGLCSPQGQAPQCFAKVYPEQEVWEVARDCLRSGPLAQARGVRRSKWSAGPFRSPTANRSSPPHLAKSRHLARCASPSARFCVLSHKGRGKNLRFCKEKAGGLSSANPASPPGRAGPGPRHARWACRGT